MANDKHTNIDTKTQALIEKAKARAEELRGHIDQQAAKTPRQLFLPGMEEAMRSMPNHIARSSLFAPVARGRKKIHKETVLVSRKDVEIRFWGEQLDESQADVWMQCLKEAQRQPLGSAVAVNRAALLRSLGRAVSGQNYTWLHQAMEALAFAMLVIEAKKNNGEIKYSIGHTETFRLIEGFRFDPDIDEYTLRIDPRWHLVFENREFALIDWEKRFLFGRGHDMAKALQRLLASSSNSPQRYNLAWLRAKMEYTGRMRDFRGSLARACEELKRLQIIDSHCIEESTKDQEQLVVWLRPKQPSEATSV